MPGKFIKITEAEWPIMEILWQASPLSAREIYDRMDSDRPDYRTVRTLVTRLVEKNAANRSSVHGMLVFAPVIEKKFALRYETRSFLDRFFGGHIEAGIAQMVEEEKLSLEDIEKLRRLLDKKAREVEE